MTETRPDPALPDGLLRDWMTIWASEAAALATDREAQEAAHRAALFTESMLREQALREARPPRTDAPAGAAPAGAAPAADELAALRRRIEELERRLAGGG